MKPRPVRWREQKAPGKRASVAEVQAANTAFWEQREPNRIQELLAAEPAVQEILDQYQRAQTALFNEHREHKAEVAGRGRKGGAAKAALGKGERVREKATELLQREPNLKRDEVAARIHKGLHLSLETTIDHLKGWWSRRNRATE